MQSFLQKVPKTAFLALGAFAILKYLDTQDNVEFSKTHPEISEKMAELRQNLKAGTKKFGNALFEFPKEIKQTILDDLSFLEEYVKDDTTFTEEGETEGQLNDPRGRMKLRRELVADFGILNDLMIIFRLYFADKKQAVDSSTINSLENSIFSASLECLYYILKEFACKREFSQKGYIADLIPPLLDENLNIEMRQALARVLRRASYFVYYYKSHDYDFPAGSDGAEWMINSRHVDDATLSDLVDLCGHDNTKLHNTMIGVISHLCHDPTGAERVGAHTNAIPWMVNSLNDCNTYTTIPAVYGLACILSVTNNSPKLQELIIGENKEIFTKASFFRSLAAVQVWDERQKCVKRLMDIMYSLTKYLVKPELSEERLRVAETLVNLPDFTLSLFESIAHKNEDTRWKAEKFVRAWTSEYYSGNVEDEEIEEEIEVEVENDEETEETIKKLEDEVKIEELPSTTETPADGNVEETPKDAENAETEHKNDEEPKPQETEISEGEEKKTEKVEKAKKIEKRIIKRTKKSVKSVMESMEMDAKEKIELKEQKEKQKIMQMMQQRQQQMQMGGMGGMFM